MAAIVRMAPKSGKPRAVPINPALLPIPRQWRNNCPASDDALVFPTARGFHGLHHMFASHFMMSGGNILTLQKLLGHSSVAVTMKYAHLAPDFMRDEIGRLCFERRNGSVTSIPTHLASTG
jgi:integrase